MAYYTHWLLENWQTWLLPIAFFAVVTVVGWFVRHMLFRWLDRIPVDRKGRLGVMFFEAMRGPFMLWVLILALHVSALTANFPPRIADLSNRVLLILWILSLTVAASRLAGTMVKHYGNALASAVPMTTLTQSLVRIGVVIVGILILLDTLHISVTPILTALGVGGLAVALALQDTLSNLFAGFYVSIAGQVRVGDYIKLETGDEGYVVDISWRSTTMRALANNLIVVPNAKLGQVIVTNYYLPEKRMSLLIPVGVSYEADIDRVERILLDVAAKGAGEIQGLLAEPGPSVRFIPGFGDSSLNFTLICQVAEFVDQYFVQHELRKRIIKRFRSEGIEIPYPIRTVHLKPSA